MKNTINILKNGILAVTLFTTFLSNASDATFITLKDGAKTTAVTLTGVKVGNLLTIKDTYGVLLYSEKIKKSGNYTKSFDFNSLPTGDYVFELDKDFEIKTMPFTVSNNGITFNEKKESTHFKPQIVQKNNMLFVSKLSQGFEAVKISIYSDAIGENELLLSETVENVQTVERIYKLEKGNYKLIIASNNREFTKFINN